MYKKGAQIKYNLQFVSSLKILNAWYPPEEFCLMTVYGPLGYGKSAYACKVLADILRKIYRLTEEDAWELLKQFIVFHPEQFFQKLKDLLKHGIHRIPGLIWDDAGYWLYALEWNDPFILRVGKYMSLARTHLGSVIMTTPTPEFIFKKIRKFPQAINVSIIKTTGSKRGLAIYKRRAKAYLQYYNIVKGYRVRGPVYQDDFLCKMPDKFYEWYKPLRDTYEDMALKLMVAEWDKVQGQSKLRQLEQQHPGLRVPELTLKTF